MADSENDLKPVGGFFGSDNALFGVFHPPREPRADVVVVLCSPLGYEGMQAYRALRLLARRLAREGFPVLRFDYHGSGESDGLFSDPGRLDAWCSSVESAAAMARALARTQRVALVGLRMGALLAGASAGRVAPSHLVFWEPCVDGSRFVKELEFAAAAAGSMAGSVSDEGQDVDGIQASGFHFTEETVEGLKSLEAYQPRGQGPAVLLLHREDRPPGRYAPPAGDGSEDVTVEATPGYRDMMIRPVLSAPPTETFEQIVAWLSDRSAPLRTASASDREPVVGRELVKVREIGGRVDRVTYFGPGSRLFGVVSGPVDEPESPRPPLVLLSGGVVPRTAVNGMYVDLARRLAASGVATLRMDIGGIAESDAGPDAVENQPYSPSLLADVGEGVGLIRRHVGGPEVNLLGLCSGAWAAFRTALDDDDVSAVVLVNPIVFGADEAMDLQVAAFQQGLGESRGRTDIAALEERYGRTFVSLARTVKRGLVAAGVRWTWPARELRRDLARLIRRGTRVAVVFSEGDDGETVFRDRLGTLVDRRLASKLDIATFSPADHIFSESTVRDELLRWLESWLTTPDHAIERDRSQS